MIYRALLLTTIFCCSFLSMQTSAHHSVAFTFDVTNQGTIKGTVKKVWFKNPHVRYYITVKDENGEEHVWDTHGHNPVTLSRTGWTKDTVKPGDLITMVGDSTRDGRKLLFIRSITLEDGRVLTNAPRVENRIVSSNEDTK
jgi:hypothetical protein